MKIIITEIEADARELRESNTLADTISRDSSPGASRVTNRLMTRKRMKMEVSRLGRTIDADALKDWLEIVPLTGDGGVDINDLVEHIDSMPTAQPQTKCVAKITLNKEQIQDAVEKAKREILAELPRWIPVTERLPEKFSYCIVSGGRSVWFARFEDGEFLGILSGHALDSVIAWQPLPAPYKEDHT